VKISTLKVGLEQLQRLVQRATGISSQMKNRPKSNDCASFLNPVDYASSLS
jgi:hypothetical protein